MLILLLLQAGEHKLTYDRGTAEESFEWLALRDLADTVLREDPAWPLPPPPPPRPAQHARQHRVLSPAEAIAAALRAGHTPEALHRMVDEAAAALAAASMAHAAPVAAPTAAPVAMAHAAVAHPPPAAAFASQGSFMADLMDEDAEPAAPVVAAQPTAVAAPSAAAAGVQEQNDPLAGAMDMAGAGAATAAQHDDGGAAPLSMQLSMSELLGEDDGKDAAAPQLDVPAASAQPATGQVTAQPPRAAQAGAGLIGTVAMPPNIGGDAQAVAPGVDGDELDGIAPAAEAGALEPAGTSKPVELPDRLVVQDSGYEADVEAAVAGGPSAMSEPVAADDDRTAGSRPASVLDPADVPAEPGQVATLSSARPS